MNVLNEVASVTANGLVCRYLSHTNQLLFLRAVSEACGRWAVLLPTCYCSQTNLSYRRLISCHQGQMHMVVDALTDVATGNWTKQWWTCSLRQLFTKGGL